MGAAGGITWPLLVPAWRRMEREKRTKVVGGWEPFLKVVSLLSQLTDTQERRARWPAEYLFRTDIPYCNQSHTDLHF